MFAQGYIEGTGLGKNPTDSNITTCLRGSRRFSTGHGIGFVLLPLRARHAASIFAPLALPSLWLHGLQRLSLAGQSSKPD